MKKWLTLTLVLLLVLGCSSLALADLYEEYGDIDYWDEATQLIAEEWTDEAWEAYWIAYEAAWEAEYQEYWREQKEQMGLPYLDGVNVALNGEYLDFAAYQPIELDGTLMLPLRDFFDLIGATTSYSEGVTTVVLTDGRSLELETGSQSARLYRADGTSRDEYLWEAPTIIQGKLYMPYDVLIDMLGYSYNYSYYYDIYYFTDRLTLVNELNEHYTILNRLLAMEALQREGNLALDGKLGLSGMLYGENSNDSVLAELRYHGIAGDSILNLEAELVLDLAEMEDTIFTALDEEDWELVALLAGAKAKVIYNQETNTVYIQSSLLPLFDENLDGEVWLKVEQARPSELLPAELTVGDLIYNMTDSYYGNVHEDAWELHTYLVQMLGDVNFTTRTSGNRTIYSLKMEDALSLDRSSSTIGYLLYYALPFYGGYYSENMLVSSIEIVEQAEEIVSVEMEIRMTSGGMTPVTYQIKLSANAQNLELVFLIEGRYVGKFSIYFEQTSTPTEREPQAAPPEGSRVLDMVDLYMLRYPALYEDYNGGYDFAIPEPPEPATDMVEDQEEAA